jgi:hypothetical protein
MTLKELAVKYYDDNDNEALFELANVNWPPIGDDLPAGIAEVCRYAFIRHHEAHHIDEHLWRARALSAAVLTGARDTVAGLLLPPFFATVDITAKQEMSGYEHGYEQARLILEEVKRLVPDDAPRSQLFSRLYHEKRGYSFLVEGTGRARPSAAGMERLREAEVECSLARSYVKSPRGTLKVRADLALIRYLLLAETPAQEFAEAKMPFLDETKSIREAAAAAGYDDVEGWAATNSDVMERGEFVGWVQYEVE